VATAARRAVRQAPAAGFPVRLPTSTVSHLGGCVPTATAARMPVTCSPGTG